MGVKQWSVNSMDPTVACGALIYIDKWRKVAIGEDGRRDGTDDWLLWVTAINAHYNLYVSSDTSTSVGRCSGNVCAQLSNTLQTFLSDTLRTHSGDNRALIGGPLTYQMLGGFAHHKPLETWSCVGLNKLIVWITYSYKWSFWSKLMKGSYGYCQGQYVFHDG